MTSRDESNETARVCADCGGVLEEGFVPDFQLGGATAPVWISGKPRGSVWTGVKVSSYPRLEVRAWRCADCGVLKLYAHRKQWATGS